MLGELIRSAGWAAPYKYRQPTRITRAHQSYEGPHEGQNRKDPL